MRGQGKASSAAATKLKKTVVLLFVLFLFPLSVSYLLLLLLLTTVIYGGHPSSGCVHHLLVARRSWQQLCVVRRGLVVPLPRPDFIPFTARPPLHKDLTLNTVLVLVPAASHKPNASLRPKPMPYFQMQPQFELLTLSVLTIGLTCPELWNYSNS